VGVIQFYPWPVYCHVDEHGNNTIRAWLDREGVSTALRTALQVQIDLTQHGGPSVVIGCVVRVNKEFEAFKGVRKGEPPVHLVFKRGIFTDQEITILACSHVAKDCIEEARRNLRAIEVDRRGRRRHERITHPVKGRVSG
jgi:hypothetical protein